LDGVATTWFIQQKDHTKGDWPTIKVKLIENFTHQDVTCTTLHQLQHMCQQTNELVAQFGLKINRLLLQADPKMLEEMKLYFLMPRLRHDIARRVHDQGPTSFRDTIKIALRIESLLQHNSPAIQWPQTRNSGEHPTPMDIDI
jgi:hypothetical protein